jgi:two-component system, NtrC family, sensor kinase
LLIAVVTDPEGERMTTPREDVTTRPHNSIAELRKKLDERSEELDAALEQQTATAEVLQVINANPGNLPPVFDIILEKAVRLCGVAFGLLDTWDGEALHTVATYGLPPAFAAYRAEKKVRRWLPPIVQRLVDTRRTILIPDSMLGEGYIAGHPDPRALVDLGGARTTLLIPLVRDDWFLGYVSLYRQEDRPFTDKQIVLLQNFAAQAVIAMENARLLGELRQRSSDLQESLEYQTATSEVLKVRESGHVGSYGQEVRCSSEQGRTIGAGRSDQQR